MSGASAIPGEAAVTLSVTSEELLDLCAGMRDYDEQAKLMSFFHYSGWHDTEAAVSDFCERLTHEKVGSDEIIRLMTEEMPFAKNELLNLLFQTIERTRGFFVLGHDDLLVADLSVVDPGLLRQLLEQAVDDAANCWVRHGWVPFESPGYLKDWLGRIAPIVMPDVLERMTWLLQKVFPRFPPVPQDERYFVSDPVEEWLPGSSNALLLPIYQMFVQTGCWRDKLEADNIDQWMCDARAWLGLSDQDDGDSDNDDGQEDVE